MSTIDEDQILKALAQVAPDMPGRVSGLQCKDGAVVFALEVDPAQGSALEPLRQKAEEAVKALPGVEKVTAVLTAQASPDQGPDRGQGKKSGTARIENLAPQIGKIIAVASGKGGVGKSTVAVNLAVALAAQGYKTGLLDADIYGPSVPMMMGGRGQKPDVKDGKLTPLSAHGVSFVSMGVMVDEDAPLIWRGPMVQTALRQFLQDVEWGALDILVVDMPPGTGDAQLTMAQKVPLAGAVIVSTPQDIALIDARKAIGMFAKTDVPVLGLVENMSSYICPRCEHEEHIFGEQGAQREAQKQGIAFLGDIPLHPDIRHQSDSGTPVAAGQGANAAIYHEIASAVSKALWPAEVEESLHAVEC